MSHKPAKHLRLIGRGVMSVVQLSGGCVTVERNSDSLTTNILADLFAKQSLKHIIINFYFMIAL
jgi:hypothetical protein